MLRAVARTTLPLVTRHNVPLRIPAMRAFATEEIVKADIVDTLEWTLTSPPPLHQFDESPIVVEIAHLDALPNMDH